MVDQASKGWRTGEQPPTCLIFLLTDRDQLPDDEIL